jgi:D-threo-aldose 1-dehydrogenase
VTRSGDDLQLSALGLGTAAFGWLYQQATDQDATDTVDAAIKAGICYLDTAPDYGLGLSEQRLGAALRRHDRHTITVSSKVGRRLRGVEGTPPAFPGAPPREGRWDWTRDGIRRSIEESLERMQLDRIDVIYLHDPDDHEQEIYESAYPALEELRSEGIVTFIGAGMNQSAMLTRFVTRLDLDVVLLAGRYTLLEQGAAGDLLPACLDRGVDVVIGAPFNSGILASTESQATYDYAPAPAAKIERARLLGAVCQRHNVPLPAAALQFPLGHPAVKTVLAGMRTPQEVLEDVALFALPIPPALWEEMRATGLLDEDTPVPDTPPPLG